jgi:hypothetical protein
MQYGLCFLFHHSHKPTWICSDAHLSPFTSVFFVTGMVSSASTSNATERLPTGCCFPDRPSVVSLRSTHTIPEFQVRNIVKADISGALLLRLAGARFGALQF